jgi:hypothetical protein
MTTLDYDQAENVRAPAGTGATLRGDGGEAACTVVRDEINRRGNRQITVQLDRVEIVAADSRAIHVAFFPDETEYTYTCLYRERTSADAVVDSDPEAGPRWRTHDGFRVHFGTRHERFATTEEATP